MKQFMEGEILPLLSTEAAGMGCDISDIIHVVQFGAPKTISRLVQRLGRAARSSRLQGNGILLVPETSETELDDKELYKYITTKTCRREILNKEFGNKNLPNKNCCDICHPLQKTPISLPAVVFKEFQADSISKTRTQPRTQDQKNLAKAEIRSVMSENLVEKLGNNFAKVTGPESFNSIIGKWATLKPEHQIDLANILINLSKKIEAGDTLYTQPQTQVVQCNNNQDEVEAGDTVYTQPRTQVVLYNNNQDEVEAGDTVYTQPQTQVVQCNSNHNEIKSSQDSTPAR
ncbi:ATP-dependent DNA helicase Q4 [Mortierella sp. AD094]|nr:ATP-dependent DNA helicase Q4 [Mortierella sp. AD094]